MDACLGTTIARNEQNLAAAVDWMIDTIQNHPAVAVALTDLVNVDTPAEFMAALNAMPEPMQKAVLMFAQHGFYVVYEAMLERQAE